jgi:outer membrane protein, multidrug efflux system
LKSFFDDSMLTSLIDQVPAGNRERKILAQDVQIAGNEVPARRGANLLSRFGAAQGLTNPTTTRLGKPSKNPLEQA